LIYLKSIIDIYKNGSQANPFKMGDMQIHFKMEARQFCPFEMGARQIYSKLEPGKSI
jgi:hypothetical protein